VRGAYHVHELTKGQPLDFFVLFSSVAALWGVAGGGLSSYAAANGFLDGLAHARRAKGLPALSIAWGPWSGGGMASRLGTANRRRLERHGLGHIVPEQGIALLERALGLGAAHVGAFPLDGAKLRTALEGQEVPAFLRELVRARGRKGEER